MRALFRRPPVTPAAPDWQADEILSAAYFRRADCFRRVRMFIWSGGIVLVGVVAATVPNFHLVLFLALVLLLTFIAAAVFSFVAWCCPRCRRPFTTAHRPGICEHCGILFARKPDADVNSNDTSAD